jgi:hypothetical protein
MQKLRILISSFAWCFIACGGGATVTPPPSTPDSETATETALPAVGPIDGVACVGTFDPLPEGVKEIADEALAKEAVDVTGKGKLCTARVFEVVTPVKVYRVWNSQKTYTEFGKWWSFSKPTGPADRYREQNAICPEWSDLDRLSVCEIKVGARFAVGPGQSATCETKTYEKSVVNQVFIPNDTRAEKVFVDHCEQMGTWP